MNNVKDLEKAILDRCKKQIDDIVDEFIRELDMALGINTYEVQEHIIIQECISKYEEFDTGNKWISFHTGDDRKQNLEKLLVTILRGAYLKKMQSQKVKALVNKFYQTNLLNEV